MRKLPKSATNQPVGMRRINVINLFLSMTGKVERGDSRAARAILLRIGLVATRESIDVMGISGCDRLRQPHTKGMAVRA